LIDEICPWCKYFFARCKASRGPKLFNVRVPLVNYMDGDIRHRLSVLSIDSK